jgi:hypothetical protein
MGTFGSRGLPTHARKFLLVFTLTPCVIPPHLGARHTRPLTFPQARSSPALPWLDLRLVKSAA